MTRIISGAFGGRSLQVPPNGTRPTSDRVREAVFSKLDHAGVIRDAVVLDLYAGSGALAFEALSRGATRAVLVDESPGAIKACLANVNSLDVRDRSYVVKDKAERWAHRHAQDDWTLVFADPPYDLDPDAFDAVLVSLIPHLTEGAWIVVETSSRNRPPLWPPTWDVLEPKKYGETTVHFARVVR